MATAGKSKPTTTSDGAKSKKRKQFLPHNRPVKKKGSYPLRPGVQGFFITCDGGRERQASREAINVIDSFFEELLCGNGAASIPAETVSKPANKKIKFNYSESESSGDEDGDDDDGEDENGENESEAHTGEEVDPGNSGDENAELQKEDKQSHGETAETPEELCSGAGEPPSKKQCLESCSSKCSLKDNKEEKSIDKLIEDEIKELGDKNKRRFVTLDSGCNGVIFIQMRKQDGDPGPRDIVQHIMQSAASTRKHMSRFILRVLPIEVACYASEEEISRAIKPLVTQYFPLETEHPQKFAVLYDARANSGIDRMKIINSVAKSVPGPHKVDLNNPDKSIVVQIVKTICLIGVVEKYKELAKYNLRQLTSPRS
ncbi:THUMP domain-containing protein 1 homolog isoform X1 [Rhodamnia argentea]|uniref:THUMP domain-containing protein 1 homolog isoform X1 n=1 Tax=Rhodamnia argentea TaxID=178133 RepID=A0A8B8NDX1_9MYRT|nr:THUMP domain-containing protein 1 homolog isoform X1 [Rhodamnia argentea]